MNNNNMQTRQAMNIISSPITGNREHSRFPRITARLQLLTIEQQETGKLAKNLQC